MLKKLYRQLKALWLNFRLVKPQTKRDYQKILGKHECEVVFTKRDGSERKMRCTLQSKELEKRNLVVLGVKKVPEHQVCVVDLDKNEWRSFTLNSVKSFKIA